MSVASTKAFYAQIAAGLPARRARSPRPTGVRRRRRRARAARRAARAARRDARGARAARRDRRGRAAARAVAGATGRSSATAPTASPPTRCGSSSRELCYKSIACDVTEDKKHIDLSSEPLILVCAAGLAGSNADDVAKEVAIYRAHKAAPIVIASEGESAFAAALARASSVPAVAPGARLRAVGDGRPPVRLRGGARHRRVGAAAARGAGGDRGGRRRRVVRRRRAARPPAAPSSSRRPTRFFDGLRAGRLRRPPRGEHRGAARRRCSATRPAIVPLDAYQVEHGKVGTPSVVIDDLTAALTRAIEELTRPVDAIKHQAKTVTVGISRTDETLLQVPLVREVLAAGAPPRRAQLPRAAHAGRPRPGGRRGHRLHPLPHRGRSRRRTRRRSRSSTGAASPRDLPSRTERDAELRGTKHRVATEREVLGGAGPPRRAHGRHRARGQGRRDRRAHAAARALRATGCRRRRPGACCRATATATRRCGTRSPRPSRRSATTCSAGIPVDRPAHRAGLRAGRPLAQRQRLSRGGPVGAIVGVGVDLVEVERFRRTLERTPGFADRLFTAGRAGRAPAAPPARAALRGAVRGQGGGDEGAGRRASVPARCATSRSCATESGAPGAGAARPAPPRWPRSGASWPGASRSPTRRSWPRRWRSPSGDPASLGETCCRS